jgi:hypothetical protein
MSSCSIYLSVSAKSPCFFINGKGFSSRVGGRLVEDVAKFRGFFLQFYAWEFFTNQFGGFSVHGFVINHLLYLFYVHKYYFLFFVDRHEKPVSGS